MKKSLPLAAILILAPLFVRAQTPAPSVKKIVLPPDNAMAKLKPGAGVEVVERNCTICHSTDYIVRQPGGDAAHWEPEVRKMIKVYGAPVSEADVQTIVAYLAAQYGSAPPGPDASRSAVATAAPRSGEATPKSAEPKHTP